MITFILPGYSPRNKKWAEDVAEKLNIKGDVRPVFWDHWEDESQKFQAKEKASLLARHTKGDKVNIVAKSVGTLVTSYLVKEIPSQINKIILNGIPVSALKNENLERVKSIPNDNLIVFQNSQDPLASYNTVKKLFPKFKIIEKKSDTHDYPYFKEFQEFLEE